MIFVGKTVKTISGGNMKNLLKAGAVFGFLAASFVLTPSTYATSTTLGDNPDSPS